MQTTSRIPKLTTASFDGALLWFSQLQCEGLLFYPEDDPNDIFRISDNRKMFTDGEVAELRFVLDALEVSIGHDKVIEAAYPVFMNVMGIQLDA